MSDELSRYLSSGGASSVSPEKLELMGKEAADLFLTKGVPLHDSVVRVANDSPGMNPEQVRRVVEFANTQAHLALHDKAKTSGAGHSYPQFELADPEAVLTAIGAGQREDIISPIDASYLQAPKKTKLSSPKLDVELEKLFLGENRERVKTAGLDFSFESGVHQIMTAKDDLVALKDTLTDSARQLDSLFKTAQEEFYSTVKEHLLEGGSFADVARAAHEVSDTETIREVMVPFTARLLKEKVAEPEELYRQLKTLDKLAHRVVDSSHPLVTGFGAVLALREECEKVATAIELVTTELKTVKKTIGQEFLNAR